MKKTLVICDIQPEYEKCFTNEKTLNAITFIDKGYGFIIDAIDDESIGEHDLLMGIKYLATGQEFDESLDVFVQDNQMHYNESMPIIQEIKKPIIFYGGSTEACLLELIFIAKALNKEYNTYK